MWMLFEPMLPQIIRDKHRWSQSLRIPSRPLHCLLWVVLPSINYFQYTRDTIDQRPLKFDTVDQCPHNSGLKFSVRNPLISDALHEQPIQWPQ